MASFGAKYPYFNPVAEEPEGKLPVYKDQEPVRVGRLVKADLTVNLASGKLFADDGLAESVEEFSSGSIAMETDDMEDPVAGVVYGCTVEGKMVRYNVGDDPPAGGLAYFKKLMRRKKVLYKGYFYPLVKAALGNDTAQTKTDSIAVEEKSAAQKAAISELVNQLNESVPGLNLAYDAERDALEGLTAAEVSAMVEKAAAQEEYEAQVARLSELYTEQSEISARLEEAQEALNTAQETGSGNTRTLQNDINELTAAQEENAAQIAELEEASREYGEKQAEAAAKTQEMTSRVEDITAKMETLQAAYEESYNAAMESIDGQLGLFNELDGSAKTSIDNLIGTLQGQVSYMETYAANIQKAMELGVDEGLIKKLSDGSEESAQILAAIVEGGEEDIAALNEQLAKVEKGKEAFSETVAEMETDFSDQMEELVRDLDDAIQDMDLSDDAYQIGENNMQGLIDGTASKKAELVRKYAEMGRAALAAYKKEVEQASPSKKFNEAGRFDIQGIIKGAEAEKANLAETYADAGRTALSAMEKSLPSRVEEPPASAAINRQTAAIVAAVRGQDGGMPGGIAIYVDKLEVRDDQDVERVARELYYLTEQKKRSRGGGSL